MGYSYILPTDRHRIPTSTGKTIELTTLIKPMKVLVATEKPFAKVAVDGIREVVEGAGYELALLEKYTDKAQLLEAVADADALIIRSDIVDAVAIAAGGTHTAVLKKDGTVITRGRNDQGECGTELWNLGSR